MVINFIQKVDLALRHIPENEDLCKEILLLNITIALGMNPCNKCPAEVLGSSFAGYVPLASQNPYPIIVYFWSILRQIINPIFVTFGQMIFLLSKSRKSATPF